MASFFRSLDPAKVASFIRFYEKGMVTLLAYWQKGWWQLHIQINREGKEGGIHLLLHLASKTIQINKKYTKEFMIKHF